VLDSNALALQDYDGEKTRDKKGEHIFFVSGILMNGFYQTPKDL
jgi:hypothetical protein